MSSWGNTFNPVKYHGLINQGATCYLNSVLQVLFMTEDFREAVERDVNENPDHDCIDRHLSSLFADLKEREAYTYKITRKLGITRVYEQKDAAEYFEKILRLSSSGASQIFHGELTHKTICSGCSAEAVRDGAFWHLPLALVDSNSEYSVVDGIENYFKALEFSGEDQIYCENCDNKSDTTIKRVIKHHPDVLMLLLKRFEFNYSYMTYVKNYHTVVVPFTLQIPENQTYELYAVVDHFGDLRSGHYTATIKDDEGWYTFNDRWVKPTDYQPFHNFKGSSSAYLLFYRKSSVSAADAEDSMETSTPEVILPATRQDDYDYDQCQDGKMRMREEAEEAEEEGNVTMVTEMKETVGSTEVGQPPELCNTYSVIKEDQDTKSCNDHESNEETKYYQDPHPNKQRHKEDVGGNAQAGEQAEKRESGHQVIQSSELEESVEVQDRDSGKQRTAEAEVSDRHEVHDRNKDDEVSSTKRSVMETGGKSEDDEQPERKGPSLIKYPDRAVDYQDNEDNAREGLRGTQEAGQDDDVKPVSVQMEGNTGEGERSSEGEKLFELQDNRREGDSEESMPGDDQTRKQDNSRMSNIPEQQRQDKIYVKEHKDGDDKHVEDQNNEGNIRQNQPEQKISVAYTKQKDVGVKRQTEEQGNTREEHVRDKADSSLRGAGSAGSGRMTENQQVGDDEKMRMREEAEEAEEEGNVTMVTEMKDTVGSTEVGQPPELCNTEEDQDTKSYNDHESNEETNYYQDTHPNKQRDEEDVGGNAQADEQAEKRETQLEESVEVQDRDSGKQRTAEAEVSDRHEKHNVKKQDEMSDRQMGYQVDRQIDEQVMNPKTDVGRKTADDEQPERKGESYPDRAVGYQDNAREGLRGTQEAGQDDDVKPVSVQMEGNTGEGERSSEGEKLFELQDNRREGDSEESMPGDDQTRKQDNSRMSNIPEQQRQDKIYVKEHKDGDDKHVEDQNNEGNIRQNQPEQKISVVSVKRQTEEHGNTREEHVQNKADSSLRGAGSAGSGRMTENQQVGDDEKTRMREEAEEAEEEGNVTMVTEMEEKRKKDGDYKHSEPDRKGKPLKKHPNRDVQYKDNEVSARHNMNEDLGGSLKVKQGDDVKPVSVQEQGDEVTKEGTTVESDEQDTKGEKGAQMCTSKKWWQHKKQSQQKPKKTCGCFPWTRQREDETSDSYQVR